MNLKIKLESYLFEQRYNCARFKVTREEMNKSENDDFFEDNITKESKKKVNRKFSTYK